ncbi:MAG: hypothetical protein KIT72_06075 [Polyangiaceae bacterium]|nr:hypothetical protein [Polyangiaceae bacterium]MCW5789967.1 hypothetical protein [Polyangiaceae bacterium]
MREQVVSVARGFAERILGEEPALHSVTLFVAQYWADNADDEVHLELLSSQFVDPVIPPAEAYLDDDDDEGDDCDDYDDDDDYYSPWDMANLLDEEVRERHHMDHDIYEVVHYGWGPYISAFAAFCPEGAHQECFPPEGYAPYAIFRRGPDGLHTEIVGVMLRPWLDGVAAEHVGEGGEEYWQAVRERFGELPE